VNIADLFYSVKAEGIDKVGNQISALGDTLGNIGTLLIDNVSKPILEVGKNIIETTMNFDQQMSRVSAVTGAAGKDFTNLRDLAIDMGSSTSKTATEAAEAIEYMGLAGWNLKQINEGIEPVLRASEAGMMDLGRTSDLVTDSMAALGIGTEDLGRYLDIAAKAQNTSNQSMEQFLDAMVTAGGSFKMFNVPLEEAGALLGILANRGYKGSEAGNALISIMANLTTGAGKAGDAMKKLGIEIYDKNGKFRGMTTILQELNKKFDGMTEAQKNTYIQMIGGKTRTKELNAMLNGTKEELGQLTKGLYNSEGALSKMAKTMKDNLAGQITQLKSKLEGIAISIGDRLTPYLRIAAEWLQKIADAFYNLPGPIKDLTIIFAILMVAVGPIIGIMGTLVTVLAGVIGAITALIALISTVGIPVFASIAGAVILLPAAFTSGIIAMTMFTTTVINLIGKMGLLRDGFETIKALISGDFQTVFDLLTKKLGMSKESAEKLAMIFSNMYDKAKVVIDVIKQNLGPAFEVLNEQILKLISGGFSKLDGSTTASKNLFVDMVLIITKWGSKLFDYLYSLFDDFGLISVKLKFSNNKIAAEFVELDAKTQSNLDNILNSQFIFGKELNKKNIEIYNKKISDTKQSLDKELDLVLEQLNKRKESELTSLQSLFNDSKVLSDTEEAKRIEKLKLHYQNQQLALQENNTRIKEILTIQASEKRELTALEVVELARLRKQSQDMSIQYISTSEAEQIRIMEEAKNLKVEISKNEAMNIITQANRSYDNVVSKAKKQRDDKINAIIQQRDGTHSISQDEAKKMIAEANNEYKSVTSKARKTRDETINTAAKKSAGVISEAEKEKREVENQTDKIKKVMSKIWNDIKKQIPSIVIHLMLDIVRAIQENIPKLSNAAISAGSSIVKGLINGIGKKSGELASKVAGVMSLLNPMTSLRLIGHAKGIIDNPSGHMAIVGEEGPELMYIPKGANIYTAAQTKGMLDNAKSYNNNTTSTQNNVYNVNMSINARDIKEVNDIIDLFNGLKAEPIY
jgi:TP901 family phage tail tape measure protein